MRMQSSLLTVLVELFFARIIHRCVWGRAAPTVDALTEAPLLAKFVPDWVSGIGTISQNSRIMLVAAVFSNPTDTWVSATLSSTTRGVSAAAVGGTASLPLVAPGQVSCNRRWLALIASTVDLIIVAQMSRRASLSLCTGAKL